MKRHLLLAPVNFASSNSGHLHERERGKRIRRWALAGWLAALSPLAWAQESGSLRATVHGVVLDYQFTSLTGRQVQGTAGRAGQTCLVLLDMQSFVADAARVVSHEVGHCLDEFVLGGTHNGFQQEGCVWGAYFCNPSEGYAEAYSRAYLAKCGPLLTPLGFPVGDGACEPPDPRSVTAVLARR